MRVLAASSRIGAWPGLIRRRASSNANHPARSTSGKRCCVPDRGGHSIVNELLRIVAGSRSPAKIQAVTRFPLGRRTGVEHDEGPFGHGPGLFLKFSARRFERILLRRVFPFRDRPDSQILAGPERTTGMNEKKFIRAVSPARHEESRALLGHPLSLRHRAAPQRIAGSNPGTAGADSMRTVGGAPGSPGAGIG